MSVWFCMVHLLFVVESKSGPRFGWLARNGAARLLPAGLFRLESGVWPGVDIGLVLHYASPFLVTIKNGPRSGWFVRNGSARVLLAGLQWLVLGFWAGVDIGLVLHGASRFCG
ncbi:hypothetical protein [Microbulbifer elongatus]|uniref:hypothetical protein n=1 Tax=Microbulbifer elongatus TaxID=86173 RepID=UPI001CFC9227|nr:hypothetical protein [Microbulbifer elongatus]